MLMILTTVHSISCIYLKGLKQMLFFIILYFLGLLPRSTQNRQLKRYSDRCPCTLSDIDSLLGVQTITICLSGTNVLNTQVIHLSTYSIILVAVVNHDYKPCDSVIDIYDGEAKVFFDDSIHLICHPKPYIHVPTSLLHPINSTNDLLQITPSLSFEVLRDITTGLMKSEYDYLHIILATIGVRRILECKEVWGNYKLIPNEMQRKSTPDVLAIWIGSVFRMKHLQTQLSSLKHFNNYGKVKTSLKSIMGWLATEDNYPCRNGSTSCNGIPVPKDRARYLDRYPNTWMNSPERQVYTGWNCAQRRPLRALRHTLLYLFSPQIVIILDDDTYFNWYLFQQFARYVIASPHLVRPPPPSLADLIQKIRRLEKEGAVWVLVEQDRSILLGGAGYVLSKLAIQRLTDSRIATRSGADRLSHSLYAEILQLSRGKICQKQGVFSCSVGDAGVDGYATLSIPLVQLCAEYLSGGNTCYHSDHAMTRCLLNAAGIVPIALHANSSPAMCQNCLQCNLLTHLTCHRWVSDVGNGFVAPIPISQNRSRYR